MNPSANRGGPWTGITGDPSACRAIASGDSRRRYEEREDDKTNDVPNDELGAGAGSGSGRAGVGDLGEVAAVGPSGSPPRLAVLEGRIVKLIPEDLAEEDELELFPGGSR